MIVNERQSLFDVALSACGTIDSIFQIAELNNLSITSPLTVGLNLMTPSIMGKKTYNYYAERKINPATDVNFEGNIDGEFSAEDFDNDQFKI